MLLLNVQSLRGKCDSLFLFLECMNFPDIILLTEHWLKPGECFCVDEYVLVTSFCRENSLHGGTLILARSSSNFCNNFVNVDKFNFLLSESIFEFSICYSKLDNIYIICIYRSPSARVDEFLERLDTLLSQLPVSTNIILAGDFNINHEDKRSVSTVLLANLLTSHSLDMHVNAPTRISRNSATTIDYMCSNIGEASCAVVSAGLSDHEALIGGFPLPLAKLRPKRRRGRVFSTAGYQRFHQLCLGVNWLGIEQSPFPFSTFYTVTRDAFERAFPLRWIKCKRMKRKPWITKGIKISAANLRSLNYMKKFSNDPNFLAYCKAYLKTYRKVVKSAKSRYYAERLAGAGNRQRESWSIVNELCCRSGRRIHNIEVDPDHLNNFYCSIATTLHDGLPPAGDPLLFLNGLSLRDSFSFFPTDFYEVREALSDIKNRRACGDDGISAEVLLRLPDAALNALAFSINSSWSSGRFPTCLKEALVIPLHKGGDLDNPSNFRPISLLPTLSKIFEKIVKKKCLSIFRGTI